MERPRNANQLATELGVDYTTIQHHIGVLEKNGLVEGMGPRYGRTYFLTDKMDSFSLAFQGILEKLEEKRPPSPGVPPDA